MVCSVVSEPAIPNPSETTRKAIKGCNFMTEMRVTKTNIAAQIRSQMLIFLRRLEKRSWKNLCNIPTAPTIRQIKN
jgi:hypothetical protein